MRSRAILLTLRIFLDADGWMLRAIGILPGGINAFSLTRAWMRRRLPGFDVRAELSRRQGGRILGREDAEREHKQQRLHLAAWGFFCAPMHVSTRCRYPSRALFLLVPFAVARLG